MVPKQCPLLTYNYILVPHLLRYVLWFARYFHKIPYIPTYPATHKPTSSMTEIGFSSIARLRLRAFGDQHPSELVMACLA